MCEGLVVKSDTIRRHGPPQMNVAFHGHESASTERPRRWMRSLAAGRAAHATSNRSRFITLVHAATKSRTNFPFASLEA